MVICWWQRWWCCRLERQLPRLRWCGHKQLKFLLLVVFVLSSTKLSIALCWNKYLTKEWESWCTKIFFNIKISVQSVCVVCRSTGRRTGNTREHPLLLQPSSCSSSTLVDSILMCCISYIYIYVYVVNESIGINIQYPNIQISKYPRASASTTLLVLVLLQPPSCSSSTPLDSILICCVCVWLRCGGWEQ